MAMMSRPPARTRKRSNRSGSRNVSPVPDWINASHPADALIRASSSIICSHSTGSASNPPTSRGSIAVKTPES
jgi:hypothetical protein